MGITQSRVESIVDNRVKNSAVNNEPQPQWELTFPGRKMAEWQNVDYSDRCAQGNSIALVFCGVEKKGDETRHTDVVKIEECWRKKNMYTVNRNDLNVAMRACINDFKNLNCSALAENACQNTLGCVWDAKESSSCSVSPEVRSIRMSAPHLKPLCTYFTHPHQGGGENVGPGGDYHTLSPNFWECIRRRGFSDTED